MVAVDCCLKHAVKAYFKSNGATTTNGKKLLQDFALKLIVVPTLGPSMNMNIPNRQDYTSGENTRTAHRHLRNILIRKSDDEFESFKNSRAWPNISLKSLK